MTGETRPSHSIDKKALILDFGGVVTRTLFETHRQTEAALALPSGTLNWRGPFDPDGDPLWRAMQADEITERDYWQTRTREVGKQIGKDWSHMAEFVRASRGADPGSVVRPEAVAAIATCVKAGKRLAILSNELDLFYGADFRERLPLLDRFDVIVDATHTNILKPDPRAYQFCLEALALPAADCVFVDDQPRNVDGARAVGLTAVLFDVRDPQTSYDTALSELGLAPAISQGESDG